MDYSTLPSTLSLYDIWNSINEGISELTHLIGVVFQWIIHGDLGVLWDIFVWVAGAGIIVAAFVYTINFIESSDTLLFIDFGMTEKACVLIYDHLHS